MHNQRSFLYKGDNPAFEPPLNVMDLESESKLLEEQGNPVQDFLNSKDYTEVSQPQVSLVFSTSL